MAEAVVAHAPPVEHEMTTKDWLAVFGSILGAFLAILDIQITNACIRDVTGGISATLEDGSWISTAYLVAEIIIIPLSGWLSHLLSLKRYLLWTTVLFLFFSVCCGLSRSLPVMILFRACQGLTGGALIPLAFQVILGLPPSKRTIGMAMFSITATFAPAIGPTIGGYLTDRFSWPLIFFMNVLPGLFMLFTVVYAVKPEPAKPELLKNVDVPGILTMAIGLSSLTIFLEEGERDDWFGSKLICWLFVSAVVFLISFVWIELKSTKAFINLRLLKQRNFGLGCLVNVMIGVAMYGALYLLPLYLTTIQNYNSIDIGKTMMWSGLPQLLVIPIVPQLLKRFDPRHVAFVGIVIFGISCLMNSAMTNLVGIDQLKWSQIVRAIGQPMLMVPLSTITMGLVSKEEGGSASGLFNMLRNLGGSVGIAMLSTLNTQREKFHSARIGEGVTMYAHGTQARIEAIAMGFMSKGFDPLSALRKAYGAVDATVRQQASVMAFNDCFMVVGCGLVGASVLILLCAKVDPNAGPKDAH